MTTSRRPYCCHDAVGHRKPHQKSPPTATRLRALIESPRRNRKYFLKLVGVRVAAKATLPLPVSLGEKVTVLRGRLWLVVALQAEVVVGTAEAVISGPRKVLRAAGMFGPFGASQKGRGFDRRAGGGGGGGGGRGGRGGRLVWFGLVWFGRIEDGNFREVVIRS